MTVSIVDIFKTFKDYSSGDYDSVATEYATLDIEFVKYIGDQVISADTSWGNATNDLRNLFVLVKGNLTVDADYTLTAAARKRGMFIYVNGDLNLNGIISMTARGASAAGAKLLLFDDGTEYQVPAVGGDGGAAVVKSIGTQGNGNAGTSGVATGACGGGGSGSAKNSNSTSGTTTSGAGGTGTSYSGGAGGGGAACDGKTGDTTGESGSSSGGAGGAGAYMSETASAASGGAGNPGGAGANGAPAGNSGTGGLLVIYIVGTLTVGASGALTSIGASSPDYDIYGVHKAGGGGSGGGHIDYFYKTISGSPTITVTGGAGSNAKDTIGGDGGAGSSRATQVSLPYLGSSNIFFFGVV